MPVAGKPAPGADLPPAVPVAPFDADVLIAALLEALRKPIVRHVADILRIDRMAIVPGSTPVPIAERATDCARAALSDVAHELREQGYQPIRGARLVHQHAAKLAVSAVSRILGADGVDHELTRRVTTALWSQEVDRDHWKAAAQASACHEPVDPPQLEPLPTKENDR